MITPSKEFIVSLPYGKIPERNYKSWVLWFLLKSFVHRLDFLADHF